MDQYHMRVRALAPLMALMGLALACTTLFGTTTTRTSRVLATRTPPERSPTSTPTVTRTSTASSTPSATSAPTTALPTATVIPVSTVTPSQTPSETPAPAAHFTCTGATIESGQHAGDTLLFAYTVKNDGTAAGSTSIRFCVQTTGKGGFSCMEIGSIGDLPVEPGASVNLSHSWRSPQTPGDYLFTFEPGLSLPHNAPEVCSMEATLPLKVIIVTLAP